MLFFFFLIKKEEDWLFNENYELKMWVPCAGSRQQVGGIWHCSDGELLQTAAPHQIGEAPMRNPGTDTDHLVILHP